MYFEAKTVGINRTIWYNVYMNYKDLQEKAKELGLPYVGVSRKELEDAIAQAAAGDSTKTDTTKDTKDTTDTDEKADGPEKKDDEESTKEVEHSVAVVLSGNTEVRRYTAEDHGENFQELASEFASKKNLTVKVQ
jgi:hypothetical protein